MADIFTLTRNQKKAVTKLSKSVLVSAEAGSEGMEVLIRRFCHIVERGRAAADEILTVTSTERSANEIKRRIAQRFGDSGRRGDRRATASAYIGTIYGFCNAILRENAFEAGVAPRFSVVGDVRQSVVAGRALDEAIEAARNDPVMAAFLEDLGEDVAKDAVLSIYRRIRALGVESSAELIASANDPAPFFEAFERCYHELMTLAESSEDLPEDAFSGVKSGLDKALVSARKLTSAPDGRDFGWEDFRRLRGYRARFRASRSFSPEMKQQVRITRNALQDFLAACLDRRSAHDAGLLLELAREFDDRYTSAKARLGVLDYDDLLRETRDLFWNSDGRPTEAARRYRDRFKFIMLFDSQDVGRLLMQILDAISRPDNLCAVGDGKQSVFGFMHGDMARLDERAGGVDGRRMLPIPLRENLRSRKGIVGFVNHFFGKVWDEEPGVRYERLTCAGDFADKAEPDVEIVLLPRFYRGLDDRDGMEHTRRYEAEAIAQRILEITGGVGGDPLRHTRKGRVGQPVKPRDIVLLLRSTADAHIYKRALEELGIDACIFGGRGFSTREVQDIISLLKAADDPLNDIAMAGVLRSPFAGISEDALFALCRDWSAATENGSVPPLNESPGRLWQAIGQLDEIPCLEESDRSRVSAFRDMMSHLRDAPYPQTVTDILDVALARSAFDLRLLAMRGGPRRYANVRKFYEVARESGAGGLFGLPDFAAHVEELGHMVEREIEAVIENGRDDVVRIMTVHKARGLHFPVVFAADMSRRLESRLDRFALDPDFGLAARVKNPRTGDFEIPLCHREIGERLQDRDRSEGKRLLYVAMTRAEEHLVLMGHSDLRGNYKSTYRETNSWAGWIEKALELGPGSPEGELDIGGCRVDFRYNLPEPIEASQAAESPPLTSRFAGELREGRPIGRADISPAALEIAENAVNRCLSDGPRAAHISRLSVSQVLDYLECPARYRLVHVIGMPEEGGEPPKDADEVEFAAADLGHLVHDLLAKVDFHEDAKSQLRKLVSGVRDESLRLQAWPLLERFAETRWCADLRASDRILRETPFELMVGGKVLAGRMDVLYHDKDGWTILDYKTGRAEDKERYELQVAIYAYAASRLMGELPARVALILLSAGEEWVQDISGGSTVQPAQKMMGEVGAAIEAGKFDPKPGKPCEWCSFSALCGTGDA